MVAFRHLPIKGETGIAPAAQSGANDINKFAELATRKIPVKEFLMELEELRKNQRTFQNRIDVPFWKLSVTVSALAGAGIVLMYVFIRILLFGY